MLTRIVRGTLAAALVVSVSFTALAQTQDSLVWHLVGKDFKRRNCWPQPFTCQDIPTVRMPFAVQVMNGWERQNMLGEHYFDPQSGQLTEAGKLKVQWILFDAPEQHRVVFVHRHLSPDVTVNRVNMVQEYAAQIGGGGRVPQVVVSNMPDGHRSGDYIDRVNRRFAATMPEPKLPSAKNNSDAD